MRVLLVEDDPLLVETLQPALKQAGYAVETASDGVDGQFLGEELELDAIILDLGLPGRPGLDVLRHWRSNGMTTPVLVLTARDGWQERVDGLKAGADDYLGKPFHTPELLARLEAITRRHFGQADNTLAVAGLTLDPDAQSVTDADGTAHELTRMEFRLLRYFMLHPGKVLSKTVLAEHAYEEERMRDSNVIEVYVNRLRQRFGKQLIETRRGEGYVLAGEAKATGTEGQP